jgi:hypothetical protein
MEGRNTRHCCKKMRKKTNFQENFEEILSEFVTFCFVKNRRGIYLMNLRIIDCFLADKMTIFL